MKVWDLRPLLDATWRAKGADALMATLATESRRQWGTPVHALGYDVLPTGGLRVRSYASAGVSKELIRIFPRALESLPPEFVRSSLRTEAQTSSSNPINANGLPGPVEDYLRAACAQDILTVNGYDAHGRGVLISTDLPRRTRLNPKQTTTLVRLAMHAVSASRLIELREDPAAVLSADGALLEIDPWAAADAPMTEVIETARRLARMRKGSRALAEETLGQLFPRLSAEWSVVGRFVEVGSEHVVLRKNPAPAVEVSTLSTREAQVYGLLQAGHHMKLIAYELGISYSTVRVLAARARAKLSKA